MSHHHCCHHGHDHHHDQHKDYAAANKEHFTAQLSDFDNPKYTELARRAAAAMRKQYAFDEESTVLMDFACGAGHISRQLAPHTKSIVGVDITQAAVDLYNQRVSNQGIPPEEMRAVCVELKGEDGELDGLKFDVIICSMSYHHFESVEDITRTLSFFLKPGAALLVLDILNTLEGNPDPSGAGKTLFDEKFHHIVAHTSGFKEDQIRSMYEGAGLTCAMFDTMKARYHGQDRAFFLAKGIKAVS
ncbi:unnamed protein product [Cyclocybe aegerita]|uniref:S-adenosyl-L-methionine-dependent methyltransferase n=1 Tax=Cyclocybe aegerita TaxID=1973307 RepID=A0A8S0W848_CYCAE|nr:unnamed protein product [Cyclocybe aegerita]